MRYILARFVEHTHTDWQYIEPLRSFYRLVYPTFLGKHILKYADTDVRLIPRWLKIAVYLFDAHMEHKSASQKAIDDFNNMLRSFGV